MNADQTPIEPDLENDEGEALDSFVKAVRRAEDIARTTAEAARTVHHAVIGALEAYDEVLDARRNLADFNDLVAAAARYHRIARGASASFGFSYAAHDAAHDAACFSDNPSYSTIVGACAAFADACGVCAAACAAYARVQAVLDAQSKVNTRAKAFATALSDFDASSDAIIKLAHSRFPDDGWVEGAYAAAVQEIANKTRQSDDSGRAFYSAARKAYETASTFCDTAIAAVRTAYRDFSGKRRLVLGGE